MAKKKGGGRKGDPINSKKEGSSAPGPEISGISITATPKEAAHPIKGQKYISYGTPARFRWERKCPFLTLGPWDGQG